MEQIARFHPKIDGDIALLLMRSLSEQIKHTKHEPCIYKSSHLTKDVPDSKVHRTNMGLTWVLSASYETHVGPMNLAIRGHIILCAYDLSIISLKGLSLLYNQSVIYIILPHWEEILTWKRLMHYWTFVRAIHWSTVDSLHEGPVMWWSLGFP